MSSSKPACQQRDDDYVPVEPPHSSTLLPGERASTVVISAAVNSLFRWVSKTKGAFRNFLLSIVAKPEGEIRSPTPKRGGMHHLPLWPMPVPFPEVFTKKVDSRKDWQKIMICMEVLALSWLHLGEPSSSPMEIRLGVALTPQQWSVVNVLRHLSFDSNTPEFVDSSMMARAAAKFENMEDVVGSLHRSLLSFEDRSYFGTSVDKPLDFDDTWMRSGSLVGRLGGAQVCGAKPVVASRLEFPSAPSFDPVPFFDAVTAELFTNPLDYAMEPHEFAGDVPKVSVHGTHSEKVELYKKLADCKRLRPVPKDATRDPFVSGLFTVNKNSKLDRLILDARPANLLEEPRSFWCGTMAAIGGLGDLSLQADEALVCSGLDLKDFFYQFVVSDQRILRNTLAGSVTPTEASYIFGRDFDEAEGEVRVALATLAMGDLLACEFSQSAHLSLCLRHAVMHAGELLTLRTPVPRSKVIAGVIIDDLVVMEKMLISSADGLVKDAAGASSRIVSAMNGYNENSLEANIKKSFFNETSCRFWGGEVDGRKGLVRSSSLRAWPLMVISMKVATLGFASVKLLETLAGAWISILTMRRRMFCVLDIIFEPLGIADGNKIIALSPALQDEISVLCCTFLLAVADLRADFLPMVSATDASGDYLSAVRAELPAESCKEFSRFSLKKGTWSRLLPPGRAELRARAKLDPSDELPGVGLTSHPLWSILARGLKYEEVWVSEVFGNPHINLLELKAFLKEEKRLSSIHQQKRCLSGLDSQVCLGALVKGRSSSPAINRALRSALAYPLGSSFHNYFMYFLSEENRADGPSRQRPPAEPDMRLPSWFSEVSLGDCQAFDSWLAGLGPEFSLSPFDFGDLDNSGRTDIRPKSHLPGKVKKKEGKDTTTSTTTMTSFSTKTEVLPSLASAAGFVPPDGVQATGSTKAPFCVGVREPFTLGSDEALPSVATAAGSVSSDVVEDTGDTEAPCSVTVPEPFIVGSADDVGALPSLSNVSVKADASWHDLLKTFPLRQFVFASEAPDLTLPGSLDLFSGNMGVAKAMVEHGAPWVLTFDWSRSAEENLLNPTLREKLKKLVKLGAFKSIGMAPICASFSKAVTPPVRSKRFPRGKPGLSKNMRRKVREGNGHAEFCSCLVQLAVELSLAFFLENPDGSWMWKQRGYEQFDDPASPAVFRLCFCRFGTAWRKATRIATSTRLRGLRMMCKCQGRHFALRGFSQLHKKMWTKVAEPYPRGLARLIAIALCCEVGWCEQKRLNVASCSRCRTLRAGEAQNPGPRQGHTRDRGTLEDRPLLSGHTQALEAKQLHLFIRWCKKSIRSVDVGELFDKVPSYAGQCLRCYGDILFQQGGALSNYRHCILALQRWKPLVRPYMHGPWELVRRWEFQEPVSHRPPLPEGVVKGLVALAWQLKWYDWCGVTLIAFYGAGRLGEILRCRRADLILPCDAVGEDNSSGFLELRRFKSLNRQPSRIQHMKINDSRCVKLLTMVYKNYDRGWMLFPGSANQYRRRWDFLLDCFAVDTTLRLTPGGLRGGSAVWAYRQGVPITQIQWNLRLRHQSTLESYIQETASLSIFNRLTPTSRTSLKRAAAIFDVLCYAASRQGDVSTS